MSRRDPVLTKLDNDAERIHFDSAPLAADLRVIGNPVYQLYVSSKKQNACYFAQIADRSTNGTFTLVTRGAFKDTAVDPVLTVCDQPRVYGREPNPALPGEPRLPVLPAEHKPAHGVALSRPDASIGAAVACRALKRRLTFARESGHGGFYFFTMANTRARP